MKFIFFGIGTGATSRRVNNGGTRFWIELARHWSQQPGNSVLIVVSTPMLETCSNEGLFGSAISHFVVTSPLANDSNYLVAVAATAHRLVKVLLSHCAPSPHCAFFSPSDFLWDVLPAWRNKRKYPGSKWIAAIHLIAQPASIKRAGGFTISGFRSFLHFAGQRVAMRLLRHNADLVLTGDYHTMAVLAEHGIPKERIAIVDMGVDFRSVSRVGQQPKLHDGCFIGRLHPQKGLMDLLDIWALVSKKMRADLTIVGDGSLRSQRHLNTEIGKRGLHHCVHQVGPKFGDEYFRILKASRILLFPSLFEGRPITPLDSMACGTPVVSYSLPSFRSSPEYGGIITVPLGDRKEFAEVVRNLLTDRALYEKACETARKSVGQYDWGTVAGRVLDLVDRVLS